MRVATRVFAVAVVAVAALVVVPLPASVSPSATSVVSQATFTTQALNAGVTRAQARTLQARVNAYLAEVGGTQIAANEIRLAGGGDVLLAMPGQNVAHQLNVTVSSSTAPAPMTSSPALSQAAGGTECWKAGGCCPYCYVCGWSRPAGLGDRVTAYYCGVNVEVPNSFTFLGSWFNNQSKGTRAYFKNRSYRTIYTTPKPFSWDAFYDWGPVWYIQAC